MPSERTITADEARALLAGLSTPWRVAGRPGGIHRGAVVDDCGEVIAECYCTAAEGHGAQVAAAVAVLPQVVDALERAEAARDQLQETINLLYADREALWRVIKEACAVLGVTDDDEKDWPKLVREAEALKSERDRLDLMLRCELGDETAAPGYAEALAAYESDPDEDEFCPPWFFDGDWHHADSGLDLHRFIDVDCGVFWSTFTTDPDTDAWEPSGPKYRSALEAMEAINAAEVSDAG